MKVLVTGSNGLVGKAIAKESAKSNYEFVFLDRSSGDLTDRKQVDSLIEFHRPNWIIHTAAKVGGIMGNSTGHGDYFYQNILMNSHIIDSSAKYGVEKLLMFSSVCVFPDNIEILQENLMLQGEPPVYNSGYGWAKRMIDVMVSSYKSQYKVKNYTSIIPVNVYGSHDLYNLHHAHVIPSLTHKIYLAKKEGTPLVCYGDGSARREFIYSKDLAKIILKILELDEIPQRIIVSNNKEYSIKEVVEKLCKIADFGGEVIWDTRMPNGQKSRSTDTSLLRSLIGEIEYTDFDEALKESFKFFEDNYPNVRL